MYSIQHPSCLNYRKVRLMSEGMKSVKQHYMNSNIINNSTQYIYIYTLYGSTVFAFNLLMKSIHNFIIVNCIGNIRTSELYWRYVVHSFYLRYLDYFEVNQPKKSKIVDLKFY